MNDAHLTDREYLDGSGIIVEEIDFKDLPSEYKLLMEIGSYINVLPPATGIDLRAKRRHEEDLRQMALRNKLITERYKFTPQTHDITTINKAEFNTPSASGNANISLYMEGVNQPNQDFAAHFSKDGVDFLILADGVGGQGGGGVAAQYLVDFVSQNVSKNNLHQPFFLQNLLGAADHMINNHAKAGKTTAIVIAVEDNEVYGSSAGDSEAYILENNCLTSLTDGQDLNGFIGSGHAAPISFKKIFTDGVLILASDGLWKYAQPQNIIKELSSSRQKASSARLADLARMQSGHLNDDISILLYDKYL